MIDEEPSANDSSAPPQTLRVGMVGYSFMGAAHSQAWRTAGRFFDLPIQPHMTAVCGRDAAKVDCRRRPPGMGERSRPPGRPW